MGKVYEKLILKKQCIFLYLIKLFMKLEIFVTLDLLLLYRGASFERIIDLACLYKFARCFKRSKTQLTL